MGGAIAQSRTEWRLPYAGNFRKWRTHGYRFGVHGNAPRRDAAHPGARRALRLGCLTGLCFSLPRIAWRHSTLPSLAVLARTRRGCYFFTSQIGDCSPKSGKMAQVRRRSLAAFSSGSFNKLPTFIGPEHLGWLRRRVLFGRRLLV